MKAKADETKETVQTSRRFHTRSYLAPPGKPIPPPSKQIHNSVNSYMEKAKSTLDATVSSAKTGEMKEKLSDNLSTLGEKMTTMFGKAKQTVQSFKNYNCLFMLNRMA